MATYQKPGLKTDSRTQITVFQNQHLNPHGVPQMWYRLLLKSNITLFMGYVTPTLTSSTTGKGSQIRRLLRKSEKRDQQPRMKTCAGNLNDEKSLITKRSRTLMRHHYQAFNFRSL